MTGHRRKQQGFTLLELLVASTVLALLAALLFSGLRFGTRVWEAGDEEGRALAELQSAQTITRRALSLAMMIEDADDLLGEGSALEGTETAVRFISSSPAAPMIGGLYLINLFEDVDGDKRSLMMTWLLLGTDPEQNTEVPEKNRVVLVDNVSGVEFAYFGIEEEFGGDEGGTGEETAEWLDAWEATELPMLVRLRVKFAQGDRRDWADLVVAPVNADFEQ